MIAAADYDLLTGSVGLLDRSDRAKLLVTGGEAAEFLQGQVTNDVEALEPGRGCYAALLTHKGKLRADMRILRLEDGFWLDAEPVAAPVLRHLFETYTVGRDVGCQDLGDSRAILSLLGPAARDRLDAAPPDEEHAWVAGELGMYVATDLGIDVIGEPAARAALAVEEVSEEAAECLRIESGRPRLGCDMGSETMPQEADLNDRAVSFTKGCYVGQEPVARLHYKGKPNRYLRGLRLSAPAEHGDAILLADREVGRIGSACVSPALGPIALAVVRREASPGDALLVNGERAELAKLPLRDP